MYLKMTIQEKLDMLITKVYEAGGIPIGIYLSTTDMALFAREAMGGGALTPMYGGLYIRQVSEITSLGIDTCIRYKPAEGEQE